MRPSPLLGNRYFRPREAHNTIPNNPRPEYP